MYFDSKHNRVLLRDGTTILSPYEYARAIVEGKRDTMDKALASFDVDSYKVVSGIDISSDVEDVEILPKVITHTDEDVETLLHLIETSKRFIDSEKYLKRIDSEFRFFEKTNNIIFLLKVHGLVNKFKEDGVIWGVGRGSSVASLILYILEAHDIDPVKYAINFSEMSKEMEE